MSASKKINKKNSSKKVKKQEIVVSRLDLELEKLKQKCLSNHKSFAEKLQALKKFQSEYRLD